MNCPECNGYTEVIDSRDSINGHIRRRRRCLVCGFRFTSFEITHDEYKQLLKNKYHKCDNCEYRGEHIETGYRAFGICKKETSLWDAENSYKAIECPHYDALMNMRKKYFKE